MSKQWKKLFIRKACDVPTVCGVLSAHRFVLQTNKKNELLFGVLKKKDFHYYVRADVDERKIGRKLYRKYFNSPSQIINSYHKGIKFLNNTRTKTAAFKWLLDSKLDSSNLAKVFNIFQQDFDYVNDNYSIRPWWALESWQHDFEDIIASLIEKNHIEDKYDLLMDSLLQPWEITGLTKVGQEVARGVQPKTLVEKYQFLRSWTLVWYKPITTNWIKSTALPKAKLLYYTKKQLFNLLKPNAKQKHFIELAPYIIFFKDWRDDLRRQHAYDWNFLFISLAKYFSITYEDIGYFTLAEISTGIKQGYLNKATLQTRKKHDFILKPDAMTSKLVALPKIPTQYRKAIALAEGVRHKSVKFKGIIAQPGFVTGLVRIIQTFHDIKKMQKGEVLVANTTHPNYLMGMKVAAAFVTDEGGVASHAAIVARELKKPCIVGTKIATKVLKDGDWVEVNASKGEIRKVVKK